MGGCKCSFRNCENSTGSRPGMHFFHYPIRDAERLKRWVEIADKREFLNLDMDKLKNKVICEEHFEERCFMNIKHERLIKTATPSIVRCPSGEIIDVSSVEVSQYEMLTIEPVSNGNMTHSLNNEPILLNNRKRPLNDFSIPQDNFVVDLNLEALHNGDLTISFDENQGSTPSPILQPLAKQKRSSLYSSVMETRRDKRILNSSLNLNAKLSAESVVLNRTSGLEEEEDKSTILKTQTKIKKSSPIPIPKTKSANITNVQNMTGSYEVIELNSPVPEVNPTVQTLDLSVITDAIQSTVTSLNILDKNCFETKANEHTSYVNDIKNMLVSIKIKQDDLAKDYKTTQESLKQISANQTVQLNLLNSKQNDSNTPAAAGVPTIKAESTTSGVKSKFNQNKIQLFNGIKKYLNPAMVGLLRMELFGSTEREWKSDEKSISVELLNLGSTTYDYIRDEWRFRLPPKKDVEKWTDDNLDDDEENSDVN